MAFLLRLIHRYSNNMVDKRVVSSFDNPYERLLSVKEVYVSLYV